MTPTQRNILVVLAILNVIVLCAVCAVASSLINGQGAQVANLAQATPQATPATRTPSRAFNSTEIPSPTNTLVIRPRPTTAVRVVIPAVGVDQGWRLYAVDDDGYAIGLPPSWQQMDVDPAAIQAATDNLKAKNPSLASVFGAQASMLAATGIKFFGFDLDAQSLASNLATNVNVLREPLPQAVNLDTYAKLSAAQLERLSNVQKPIAQRRVSIAAGDAQEFKYSLKITQPNGETFSTATTQYLVVRGQDAFVITLTTSVSQEKNYAATFEKIGKSFRWLSR